MGLMIFWACRTPARRRQVPVFFVTGTYATYAVGAYCTAWDTLYIHRRSDAKNLYRIDRVVVFQRNAGKCYFPVETNFSRWQVLLPVGDTLLTGLNQAPNIWFSPSTYSVKLDGITYTRVE